MKEMMMTTQISKTTLGVVVTALLFALILLLPNTVGAQSATFTSEADCNARLSKKKSDSLQTYGEKRYNNRKGVLNGLDNKVDAYYSKFSTKVGRYEKAYKKNTGKDSGISDPYLTTHKKFLKDEIKATQTKLDGYNSALKQANDSTGKAKQICSIIYQLRVNSYLKGKVKWQSSIDSNRTTVTVNKIRKLDTLATYEKNKSRYKNKENAEKIINRLNKVDPYQLDARFDKITRETWAITPEKINSATPPKAIEEFKKLVPDAASLFADARTQTSTITDIRKDLKKEPRRSASSSGQSSGTGGTRAR